MKLARTVLLIGVIVYGGYLLYSSLFSTMIPGEVLSVTWEVGEVLIVNKDVQALVVAQTDYGYLIVDSADGDLWHCAEDDLDSCLPTNANCFQWIAWEELKKTGEYIKCLGK